MSTTSCRVIDATAKFISTAEDSCRSDAGEFDSDPIAADSCKPNAIDSEDICETIHGDPMPAPSVTKMGSPARRSKLSRFQRGRQRDRRVLQANTEMDLELLRDSRSRVLRRDAAS